MKIISTDHLVSSLASLKKVDDDDSATQRQLLLASVVSQMIIDFAMREILKTLEDLPIVFTEGNAPRRLSVEH